MAQYMMPEKKKSVFNLQTLGTLGGAAGGAVVGGLPGAMTGASLGGMAGGALESKDPAAHAVGNAPGALGAAAQGQSAIQRRIAANTPAAPQSPAGSEAEALMNAARALPSLPPEQRAEYGPRIFQSLEAIAARHRGGPA